MTPNTAHPEDRETLSALFDGELQGNAARFVHKRLGHDAGWRETVGRWQLAGDVLRRQAPGVAPAGFAARVTLALEAERHASPASATGTHGASFRRRWIPGAALAASVAVAALFVMRPDDDATLPAGPMEGGVATSADVAPAGPGPVPAPRAAPAGPARETAPVASVASAAPPAPAAAAVAATPGPAAADAIAPAPVGPADEAVASIAPADAGTPVADPFSVPGVDAGEVERPWPRAVLPAYGDRGFTVDYGRQGGTSFYPFDPGVGDAAAPTALPEPTPPPPPSR